MIVASGINFIDIAGAEFFETEAKYLARRGGKLFIYGAKEGVCTQLRKGGYLEKIGRENIFTSKTESISVIYQQHLDKSICNLCDKRIFRECQNEFGAVATKH